MSITVKKIELPEQQLQNGNTLINVNYLNLLSTVEVECQIRLGTVTMTVAQLQQLKQGQTLQLHQKLHEPIDVLLNNHVIARGELLSIDDVFAIQITEIAL